MDFRLYRKNCNLLKFKSVDEKVFKFNSLIIYKFQAYLYAFSDVKNNIFHQIQYCKLIKKMLLPVIKIIINHLLQ